MAHALASPRPSAHVIPLPGAAAAPIVNPPRPRGRWPAHLVGIWRGTQIRAKREVAAARARKLREVQGHPEDMAAQAGAIELLRAALAHMQEASYV